jgi:hypothetical protein
MGKSTKTVPPPKNKVRKLDFSQFTATSATSTYDLPVFEALL